MVVNRGPVLRAAPLSSTRQGNGFLEEVGQVGVVEGLLVEVRGLLKEAADWRGAASAEVLPEGRAKGRGGATPRSPRMRPYLQHSKPQASGSP